MISLYLERQPKKECLINTFLYSDLKYSINSLDQFHIIKFLFNQLNYLQIIPIKRYWIIFWHLYIIRHYAYPTVFRYFIILLNIVNYFILFLLGS